MLNVISQVWNYDVNWEIDGHTDMEIGLHVTILLLFRLMMLQLFWSSVPVFFFLKVSHLQKDKKNQKKNSPSKSHISYKIWRKKKIVTQYLNLKLQKNKKVIYHQSKFLFNFLSKFEE